MTKRIHLLATGGTIAGVSASPTRTSGYQAGALPVEALLATMPGLTVTLEAEQLFAIDSKDIDDGHWLALHHRISTLAARPDCDGVVVTHGTDTLEETAYFLNLTV
jgi:L-asparaginase